MIGAGAMGRVYRATDPAVGRRVALKTIRPEHLGDEVATEYLGRFQREARAAGALSHPNIVSIFDVGEDFIVMELLEGSNLEEFRERGGVLTLEQALDIFSAVAAAIDSAHASGVIHRDIKPSNIMILPDGRPKLMDFGVARLESSVMTRTGQALGSPAYMAPEQIAGRQVTGRSDLFSFAVVVYEALTGQRPFQGDTITTVIYRVVNEPAPPPRQWRSDLPAAYDGFFEKALAKKPEERYSTAYEFIAALRQELGLADAVATVPPGVALGTRPPPAPIEHPPARSTGGDEDDEMLGETAVLSGADVQQESARRPLVTSTAAPAARKPGRLAIGLAVAAGLLAAAAFLLPRLGPVAPSQLSVQTTPAGASVQVDGVDAGLTPLSLDVEPGSHTLHVALEGHAPATMSFDVRPGEQPAPLHFDLVSVVARLRIDSRPSGADVFVNGEKIGTTPLADLSVNPGRVDLLVNRVGSGTWRRTIEMSAGESVDVEAVLEAMPSRVVSPSRGDDVYEVGPGMTPPRRVEGDPASVPREARRAGRSGAVTVEMIVTEEGIPIELKIVESAGEVLDRAVLEAVRGWRYEPAERAGEKVRVRWRVRQTFDLGG